MQDAGRCGRGVRARRAGGERCVCAARASLKVVLRVDGRLAGRGRAGPGAVGRRGAAEGEAVETCELLGSCVLRVYRRASPRLAVVVEKRPPVKSPVQLSITCSRGVPRVRRRGGGGKPTVRRRHVGGEERAVVAVAGADLQQARAR